MPAACHSGQARVTAPSRARTACTSRRRQPHRRRERLLCTTCHAHHNADLRHGPPGAQVWLLAPVAMQWWGKTSAEICGQIKDPARNGGRTLAQVAEHVAKDRAGGLGLEPRARPRARTLLGRADGGVHQRLGWPGRALPATLNRKCYAVIAITGLK